MIKFAAKPLCVLVLLCGTLTPIALAQECYDYQNTFQVAGTYPVAYNIKLLTGDQDRGLARLGTSLIFLDLEIPQTIVELAQFDLGEMVLRAESQHYKAVLQCSSNLYLMDWSDPTSPIVGAPLSLPAGILRFTYIDDQVLVSRGDQGVDIYQCTPELGLVFLHNIATPGFAQDATIDQGYLVVADQDALNILDTSIPSAPVLVHSYNNYGVNAEDRDVRYVDKGTDHLVVAAIRWQGEQFGGPTPGLEVMSLNSSGILTLVGQTYFTYTGWPEYAVTGDRLHVSSNDAYLLFALDSYPEESLRQAHSGTGTKPLLASEKTVLYQEVATLLSVFDIEYPFFVFPHADWTGAGFHGIPGGQLRDGFMLKDQTTWSGMVFSYESYLYDIQDPMNPLQVGSYSDNGGMDEWADSSIGDVGQDMVLMNVGSSFGSGCILYDLRGGGGVLLSFLPYHGAASFDGTRIYQSNSDIDSPPGFAILDAATPGSVTELGFVSSYCSGAPFVLSENLVASISSDFILFDASDPSNPVQLDALDGVSGTVIGRIDDLLFLSTYNSHFMCIDASNAEELAILWDIPDMGVRSLSIDGTMGAVSFSNSGDDFLYLYDLVSDPDGPVVLSPSLLTESTVYSCLLDAGILYTGTMEVFDVTNASQPKFLGRGSSSLSSSLFRQGNFIATSSGCFPVQCDPNSPADEGQDLPPFTSSLQLAVSPNPFNPQTAVQFVLPEAADVHLCVYDLSGRKVRTLVHQHLEAGLQSVTWNGQDDLGRAQASGVYFAHLEAGMMVEITKMALLR